MVAQLTWRKSTYSADQGACVEVGAGDAVVGVRDSADRDGPVLTFGARARRELTGRLRQAEGAAGWSWAMGTAAA